MLGALVAIISAFCFSLSDVTVRRGVTRAPVAYGAIVTVLLGVPLFFIACTVTGQVFRVDQLDAESYGLLAAAGIVHYFVGRYFNYAALEAIGAARAAPINALGLPYSVIVAFLFLEEDITAGMVAGIALIMIGPAIMIERRARRPVAASVQMSPTTADAAGPEGFRLRQTEGYLFAIVAAICYGTSPVLIRSALEGESGVSLLGGLVSYIGAGGVLLLSLLLPSRRHLVKALGAPCYWCFRATSSRRSLALHSTAAPRGAQALPGGQVPMTSRMIASSPMW
jgi:drug/metabolite transporter (DMT)-like permease